MRKLVLGVITLWPAIVSVGLAVAAQLSLKSETRFSALIAAIVVVVGCCLTEWVWHPYLFKTKIGRLIQSSSPTK